MFSGVLLIGEEGEAVYHRALGEHEGRPLTTRTPLRLASVTKPLTATAVLALVEDGRLDLEAPAGRYLPDWPYPAITLRHQDLSWEFVLDESGVVTGLMLQGHPETLGKKVE